MAPHSESDKDGENLNFEIWGRWVCPTAKTLTPLQTKRALLNKHANIDRHLPLQFCSHY
jgi:hypothetical protein